MIERFKTKNVIAAILAVSFTIPVHAAAGGYLLDEDIPGSNGWQTPSKAAMSPKVPQAQSTAGNNQTILPFDGMRSTLNADTNDLLAAVVSDLKTASNITLTYSGNGRTPKAIAQRHAAAVKAKLRTMGIYASVIVEILSGHTQPSLQLSWSPRIQQSNEMPYPNSGFGGMSPEKQFMLQKIMEASAQGKITPDAALSMMRELTGTEPAKQQSIQPQSIAQVEPVYSAAPAQPALTYASYTSQTRSIPAAVQEARNNIVPMNASPSLDISAAPETRRQPTWQLNPSQTLKEHMEKWAKKEGYDLDWQASNYYKINRAQTLTGDYLDVVNQIAGAISPTKVSLNRTKRLIRVTD